MLQYVIDSFQHRDVELNEATFPSLTTGYCQRIKSQLCLKWYNKYTVQGRFLSCWSGKLVFTRGVGGGGAPKSACQQHHRCHVRVRQMFLLAPASPSPGYILRE